MTSTDSSNTHSDETPVLIREDCWLDAIRADIIVTADPEALKRVWSEPFSSYRV